MLSSVSMSILKPIQAGINGPMAMMREKVIESLILIDHIFVIHLLGVSDLLLLMLQIDNILILIINLLVLPQVDDLFRQ